MAAMMMMPPRMTSRDVHRSRAMRRLVRARETTSGRAGETGPPAPRTSELSATYWTLFSSSLAMEAGMGKYPSLITTSCPSFETISFTNSRVSGSSGLPGALLT